MSCKPGPHTIEDRVRLQKAAARFVASHPEVALALERFDLTRRYTSWDALAMALGYLRRADLQRRWARARNRAIWCSRCYSARTDTLASSCCGACAAALRAEIIQWGVTAPPLLAALDRPERGA